MPVKIFQVDAFTDQPFSGNPAAVCILEVRRDDVWMQNVAMEMNLSETAFLLPHHQGFNLRWFTPTVEVDLCGHATLAAAHVIWQSGIIKSHETARFDTKSGLLTAQKKEEWIELDFPSEPEKPCDPPKELLSSLNVAANYVGKNRMDFLVEVDSEETVKNLKPNLSLLAKVSARGVIVTSRSQSPQYDFVSRFFAPAAGIDEDPVTGSAHCCLGPYWSSSLGKREMIARQVSQRGGTVRVRLEENRTILGGNAVTVFQGNIV